MSEETKTAQFSIDTQSLAGPWIEIDGSLYQMVGTRDINLKEASRLQKIGDKYRGISDMTDEMIEETQEELREIAKILVPALSANTEILYRLRDGHIIGLLGFFGESMREQQAEIGESGDGDSNAFTAESLEENA